MRRMQSCLKHVNDLGRLLSAVRRPYLNVDAHGAHVRALGEHGLDLSRAEGWAGIKHLSNDERDQIDLHARVVLSKCAERVRDMERIEKRASPPPSPTPCAILTPHHTHRTDTHPGRAETLSNRGSGVLRLLPSRLLPTDALGAQSDYIASHNAGVTWFLGRRLAEASAVQRDMQEDRVRRQMERARTLGSGAAREAALLGLDHPVAGSSHLGTRPASSNTNSSGSGSWMPSRGSSLASSIVSLAAGTSLSSSIETTRPSPLSMPSGSYDGDDDDALATGSDGSFELSQSQIQQFESENAAILKSVHDTLASVQKAESSLLDIAALQTELFAHLEQQSLKADELYEHAIDATEHVGAGNAQLVEARRRQKDSRLFILVFLLGASFALLFLHYY
ncbi:hypothetical protein BKA62DRAFT_398113 [Auriculariales sp. MPI-PUGE-AT-0066]|nr:hypothetical protein BKA62DRAFT_398113 [Auriculariales sp. MPI-PUGE-AT-0066]